jgi:uncharacterized protein
MADVNEAASPPIQVRDSHVHGRGVFATRRIAKGERIIEYLGERVSHDEADRRYEGKDENDSHTFLFIVDSKTVIDAGVAGNDARFFNHSCNPNCESVVENRRVFIEALRAIEAGEEMTYDYQLYKEEDDPENIDQVFACHCGFEQCRGTMLWPPEPKKKRRAKQKTSARRKESVAGKKTAAGKPFTRTALGKRSASGKKSAAAKKSGRGRGTATLGRRSRGTTGRPAGKKARRR